MKNLKMVLVSLLFVALPICVSALEDWEVYEKGIAQVKLDEVTSLEESLKSRVEKLNADDIYSEYTYKYSFGIVKAEKLEDYTKKATSEIVKVDKIFKSYNEAFDYYNAITVDAPYYKGEADIQVVKNDTIVNGEYKEITCEKNGCETELADLNSALKENQTLDYTITSKKEIQYGNTTWFDYEDNDSVKLFDSISEIEEYMTKIDLTKEGWKYRDYRIDEVSITNETTKTYKELVGKEIYEEEDEAIEALNKFKADYPNYMNTDIIKIEDPTEDSYIYSNDTETYTDRDSAEKRKEELTSENVTASVEEKITDGALVDIPSMTFDSYEAALAQLEVYKNQGYIIDSYDITKNKEGYTGKVLSAKKDDASKTYTFDKEINYILVKQGQKGTVAVWTPIALTETEQAEFRKTYKEIISGIDGSTSGDLDITFISGYNTFDLSNLGNGWGTEYTFSKNNDGTTSLNIPSGAVSHTVSGVLEERISSYTLTGKMHTVTKEYYVLLRTFVKGYDFKVVGEAKMQEEITKYKLALQYDEEIETIVDTLKYRYNTKVTEESYILNYEKYSYETYELATIDWQIERILNGQGSDSPLPPFTGVRFNHLGIILINLLGLALFFKKKRA